MRFFFSLAMLLPLAEALAGCSSTAPTEAPEQESVTVGVAPSAATVALGQTLRLTAWIEDGSGQQASPTDVVWTSSQASIAAVGSDGMVQGLGLGRAQIVASWQGVTGVAVVTVIEAVPEHRPCAEFDIRGAGDAPAPSLCR